ncbi:glycosyltransferase [Modestobacter sp. I12A-02628]|uniref:Glycosyltransferase n=1 Tax=Goekera deserti TaxID=2497753 RepID=A0A7K3WF70_9ACTN|nr:glycosyltransferase [Goekera deserti]MPQ97923.1 glycosyltransferase [Goekera deserti]NDI48569.1 glycosyltransferase [Goekera deserti]NEL55052.1 glycosyltransferase [Goekera deserti]
MRIVFSIASLDAVDGGPSNAVLAISRELALRSHDVIIVAPGIRGERYPDSLADARRAGVHISTVWVKRKSRWRYSLGLARQLKADVRTADTVSIHGFYQFPALFTYHLCRLYGKPFVLQPHGALEPYQQNKSKVVKRVYMRLGGRGCIRRAVAVNSASDAEASNIGTQFPEAKPRVIGMGIPTVGPQVSTGDSGSNRSNDALCHVLFLSRIARKKRLDLLVSALSPIADLPWQLSIAGTGSSAEEAAVRSHIEKLGLTSRVLWLGHVENATKDRALRNSDIFVLPSENENFGQVVTEAMAFGLPVVTTKQVGAAEHVLRSEGGIVIPRPDAEMLSSAIATLIAEPAKRQSMGSNARLYATRFLTWQAVAGHLEEEFQADQFKPGAGI